LKHVYRYGLQLNDNDTVAATNLLAQTLADNFGTAPNHYVTAYESSFATVVDALGGIDVVMPADFEVFKAGVHHLDGAQTVHYLTSMTSPGIPTETARMERHRAVLVALREKALSPGILQALPELWQVFATSEVIKTDLSPQQLLDLVILFEQIPESQVTFNVHTEI
jgi:anionic cell wall polymer biosynthesis LytR-Cps2A-Psr (LCP) family protein